MADFVDDEASESEEEHELNSREKAKRAKAMEDSSEDDEDDEARYREELKDFVDDNLVESDAESDDGENAKKRKNSDDEDDYDDRLEDDDYELLEENLGVSVKRKRFKRLRRIEDQESDDEIERHPEIERDAIANELFDAGSGDDDEQRSVRSHRPEAENFNVERSEEEESDADDFIVDDDGRPIAEKRKKKRPVFSDAALQQAQDIFGVDFDYDDIAKHDENSEEEDEYMDDESLGEKRRRSEKPSKKSSTRKTIFEIYEPSELQRGHFTDRDHEIRNTDIPERMQTRSIPVTPVAENSNELDLEADWIYNQAFCRPTISIQDAHLSEEAKERAVKGPQTIPKIKKSLDFMRNQNFEVPFISFYRKEHVQPELNINDLWKIYKYDGKWCELRQRKESLLSLFERMREYQLDEIMKNPDAPLPENIRIIKEDDIDRLREVETSEELNDVHHHFMLYYANDVSKMQREIRERQKLIIREEKLREKQQRISDAIANGENPPFEEDENFEIPEEEYLKQAPKSGSYAFCQKAGLDGFAKKFGLTPEKFAENLRDNYQRHEVEQDSTEPYLTALDYRSKQFEDPEDVLKAVQLMVAIQLANEPLVRKCVREIYMERAKISVRPTKKGIKEIDENHPIYAMKYLKDKPVKELVGGEFLKITIAEEDKLVEIEFNDVFEGNTSENYVEEMKQLFHRDEFSKNVQEWNKLRVGAAEMALGKIVLPDMKKELRANLLAEAKEFVLRSCCRKMYNWIKVAPYCVNFEEETEVLGDEDDWDAPAEGKQKTKENDWSKDPEWEISKGIRIMGLAYVPDFSQAAFACLISPDGECTDYLKIPHILRRKNSINNDEKSLKIQALTSIRDFISAKKPHVIAIGGESREAIMLTEDLNELLTSLKTEENFPTIKVEIIDNELAKIYANSNRAIEEFRDYPILLRQSISIARRLRDPLVEFSQLCTTDEEILCLKYNFYQDQIPKDDLLENLNLEFVNRVNEVGVDINRSIGEGYSGNLLQFVCGLGPRKSQALIKLLKQTNKRIENRTQLVTICHMGPKIFINCAGFIKIDTSSLGDSTEAYVEILDGTRVHPETYEWARKMAIDALEYDDEEADRAGALEEIIEAPERLKDLDLDAFAEELERQGFGDKCTTLYDIRAELNCRYKDLRAVYESPTAEKLFDMLTKETPETFYIGKLILANVTGFNYRKPEGEQLDQANPVRSDETGFWQCPFCMKNDFPELLEVWNHFDAGACMGKAIGVRLRLDNGISGYINVRNLSDKHVKNPEDRVRPGQVVNCRIIKIEVDRFGVECTSKTSDLVDKNNEMRPQRDLYYDIEAEERDMKIEEDAKKLKQQRAYIKRVIVHPSFHNISYSEAAKMMEAMKQGEAIIRPSSKGENNLTVTWKVTDTNILHHIDVREEDKKFNFSLGKKLWIGNEEFEDLDEIIARHVNPMASYASELLECHYYTLNIEGDEAKAEEVLNAKKNKKPNSIPIVVSASKNYPSKFMLSYLPRQRCVHEYISVTPDGVRFRSQIFPTIGKMFSWFKINFREIPRVATPKTPAIPTPVGYQDAGDDYANVGDDTPNNFSYNTPRIAASGGYGGSQSQPGTPYTPTAKTPFLTPYQTPSGQSEATPKYGQQKSDQKNRKISSGGPNFCADPEVRSPAGFWSQSDDGTFTYKSESDLDILSSNSRGRGRGGFRGRGNRGNNDFRGRGNCGNRGNNDFRGRGNRGNRGNNDFRGGRGVSRNNSSANSSNSTSNNPFGDSTPLWDEAENWDAPENPSAKAPTTMGNQTPLWDEAENCDSPGEASLPSGSSTNNRNETEKAYSENAQISNRSFRGRGNNYGSSRSRGQQSFRGRDNFARRNSSNSNSGPQWNEESWDDDEPSKNSGNSAKSQNSTLTNVNSGPNWNNEESWDDDEGKASENPKRENDQTEKSFNGGSSKNLGFKENSAKGNAGPNWGTEESWDDDEPMVSNSGETRTVDPFRQSSQDNSTNVHGNNAAFPQWDAEENWDDADASAIKTPQNSSVSQNSSNSQKFVVPTAPPPRQSFRGNSRYDSSNQRQSFRGSSSNYSRNGSTSNYSRGRNRGDSRSSSNFQSRGSFRGQSSNNFRGRGNSQYNSSSQYQSRQPSNSYSSPNAASSTKSSSLFGNDENWDDDISASSQSDSNSSQNHNSASQQNPPKNQNNSGPNWDTNESWDEDPPVSAPPKASASNFPKKYNEPPQNPPKNSNNSGPNWDTNESWDEDPPVSAPPKASASNFPKKYNEPPQNPPKNSNNSGPNWDTNESWDEDPPVSAPPKASASNFPKKYNEPPQNPPKNSNNSGPNWDTNESWDEDPPVSAPPKASASNFPKKYNEPPQNPPKNSNNSGPNWDTNESWDDESGENSGISGKSARAVSPAMSSSSVISNYNTGNLGNRDDGESWNDGGKKNSMNFAQKRQFQRNDSGNRGSYRGRNNRGSIGGGYRQHRENRERGNFQGGYRQHRENKEASFAKTPYERPTGNCGRGSSQSALNEPRNSTIPQIKLTNETVDVKNPFGDEESWD